MRQSERRLLLDVGGLDAEVGPVTYRVANFGRRVSHDDADIGDASIANGLEAVEQDWFVRDGDELLGRGVRDGAQPSPGAAGQDERFHDAAG